MTPDEPPNMNGHPLELVPRYPQQGYAGRFIDQRRQWVEERVGARLTGVAAGAVYGEALRGNIENPIGTVQMPLGVAGPLRINGQHAVGDFYVPLATTEGALVRSYERGMVAISRSGGATTYVEEDQNRISPIFTFPDVARAHEFIKRLHRRFNEEGIEIPFPIRTLVIAKEGADGPVDGA